MFQRILVGYRERDQGDDAVALAADLARLTGASVVVATVVPAVWLEHFGAHTGRPIVHTGARERAAAALDGVVAELGATLAPGRVERRLEASSSPAFGLYDLAEAEHADLVVLGSSHRGAVGRATLGRTADRVLHGAPCAVAVAPAGYARQARGALANVAAAYDGSPEARLALHDAHALALRGDGRLRILTVLAHVPPVIELWEALPGLEDQERIERDAALERQEQVAASAVDAAIVELDARVPVETHVLRGEDVPTALLDAVGGDTELLVLGSRGYGPLRRTLLGSVSVAVMRESPVPVIVVPRGA